MFKRALGGVAVLLASAGCAGLPAASDSGRYADTPLKVDIFPGAGSGGLVVDVSRPANVAVFRISPGRGTALVYPRGGFGGSGTTYTHGGLTWISPSTIRFAAADLNRRSVGFVTNIAANRVDFYYVIASEEPLNFDEIGAFGSNMPYALRSSYISSSPYQTMENLATLLIPDWEQANWMSDFYVDWPSLPNPRPTLEGTLVRFQCGNRVIYVPLSGVGQIDDLLCSDLLRQGSDSGDGEDEEVTPDNEDPKVTAPARREPKMSDRISSSQLQEPREWETRRREVQNITDPAFGDGGSDRVRPGSPASGAVNRDNFSRPRSTRTTSTRNRTPTDRSPGARTPSSSSGSGRASSTPAAAPRSAPRDNPPAVSGAGFGQGGDSE